MNNPLADAADKAAKAMSNFKDMEVISKFRDGVTTKTELDHWSDYDIQKPNGSWTTVQAFIAAAITTELKDVLDGLQGNTLTQALWVRKHVAERIKELEGKNG